MIPEPERKLMQDLYAIVRRATSVAIADGGEPFPLVVSCQLLPGAVLGPPKFYVIHEFSRATKPALFKFIHHLMDEGRADVLAFVSKAWYLITANPDGISSVKDHPERREAMSFYLRTREHENLVLCPIEVVDGKRRLAEVPMSFDAKLGGALSMHPLH